MSKNKKVYCIDCKNYYESCMFIPCCSCHINTGKISYVNKSRLIEIRSPIEFNKNGNCKDYDEKFISKIKRLIWSKL